MLQFLTKDVVPLEVKRCMNLLKKKKQQVADGRKMIRHYGVGQIVVQVAITTYHIFTSV